MVVAIALPAAAGELGSVSGYVKDSSGVPQMGAMVELFAAKADAIVFTDARGYYRVAGLGPGLYQVKVSAPSFLPALREDVSVRSGASLVVNVTLNTLFEALQMMPVRPRVAQDDEDWKWTLRSMANRPVLRVVNDDGPLVVVSHSDRSDDKVLKAHVAFLAGSDSDAGGNADMTTTFRVERSLFTSGTISLDGNVGYNSDGVIPGTSLRASYSHQMPDGSLPEVTFTMKRFATPELAAHNAALQALAMSLSDTFNIGNLELNFGSELQSIQFAGRVTAMRPFGSADLHLSPNMLLEYKYATSEPNMRRTKGFDSAPADLSESGPRVSLANWAPVLEHAHHQEISLSRRIGRNNLQLAFYSDRISDPALTGIGNVQVDSGMFLPDIYSGTFSYAGTNLDTDGLRFVYQRKINSDLTATIDYSYGGVLDLQQGENYIADIAERMQTRRRHAVGYKMSGTVPYCKTRWLASYSWTSGQAITPVDLFNSSAGQMDPFLNVFVRQPIPGTGFMPGHMEALIDVRNLLAQGYVPVYGQDGRTLYLVQSARAIRGGLAFTF